MFWVLQMMNAGQSEKLDFIEKINVSENLLQIFFLDQFDRIAELNNNL